MSWIVKKPAATDVAPNWLRPYCKQFREELVAQGYAAATMRTYDTATRLLCEEIARRGLRKGEFAGRVLSQVQAAVLKAIHPNKHTYAKILPGRFIDALVQTGAAERPKAPRSVPTALDQLVAEYEAYLREQRGLTQATIYHCVRFLHRFMAFRFGGQLGDMNLITVEDIARFLHEVMSRKSPYRDRTPPTHLRNLFRFLFWSGKTKRDLASCLPRVAIGRASHLPRSLRPEEIERLIEAVWSADAVGRRNYAMLMLLARLGLRATEVIAIELDDIDWRAGMILIRGKGKQHDRMPLPEDAGQAIVDYIRNGRPGSSRRLFVSSKVPYRPFVDAQILNTTLRAAFKTTGLRPPQKYIGSHLMRHVSQRTCCAKARRWTRSAMCCGTALEHRRRSMPGTTLKAYAQSPATGRSREVKHDHPHAAPC